MAVSHLECKECKAQYAAEALYVCERCFGPLEVVYARQPGVGDVRELRRRIQGGPQNFWRYADFLPLAGAGGSSTAGSGEVEGGSVGRAAGAALGCSSAKRAPLPM